MKAFLSFCAVVLAVAVVAAEDIITEEDAEYIQNEQKFKEFFDCMMDKGPCSDKLKAIKEALPIYIETACGDCSPKQKEMFVNYNKMILEKYPQQHKELMDKYAPKNE